ncbi:MAG: hypothetical protein M3511_15020, partial [Deinococcota bacterium]|nr:hypothetical protein [Deinococcota bacterium]
EKGGLELSPSLGRGGRQPARLIGYAVPRLVLELEASGYASRPPPQLLQQVSLTLSQSLRLKSPLPPLSRGVPIGRGD